MVLRRSAKPILFTLLALCGGLVTPRAEAAVTAPDASLLVIRVAYNDRPTSRPFTDAELAATLAQTRSFYALQTAGEMTLTTRVVPTWVIGAENWDGRCSDFRLHDDALAGARAQGFEPNDYTNVAVYMADAGGNADHPCAYGTGSVSGRFVDIWATARAKVLIHEPGHNFGARHAHAIVCTRDGQPVPLSDQCTSVDYGDQFSSMGGRGLTLSTGGPAAGAPLFATWQRQKIGQLRGSQVTVERSGPVTLDAADTAGQSSVLVPRRIPGQAVSSWFALEKRNPQDPMEWFTATDPVANGVTVRLVGASTTHDSDLLDMHPMTPAVVDAALAPGESFTDPASGVQIAIRSVTTVGADVAVTFPEAAVPTTPAPPAPTVVATAEADTAAPQITTRLVGGRLARNRQLSVRVKDDSPTTVTIRVGLRLVRGTSITLTRNQSRRATVTITARDVSGNVTRNRYVVRRGVVRLQRS